MLPQLAPKEAHADLLRRVKRLREATHDVGQQDLQRMRRIQREIRRNAFSEYERLTGILSSSRMPSLRTALLLQARREELARRVTERL